MTTRLKSLLTLVAAIISLAATAQTSQLTAADAFANAPASVFPLLDRNTRLDMIDYFNSGSETASQNALQGRSRVTALSPESIELSVSGSSTYQLVILPEKSTGGCIALIETVATPAPDSHITFYSPSWQQYDTASRFAAPTLKDWLNAMGSKNPSAVTNMVPFMLASYVYDPATSTLTLTNNLKQFLSADIYSMVSSMLLDTMTYKWNGSKMVKQN